MQVFLTPEYLAIAMEYAAGGDMFQLVVRQRGLLEQDARWYFQQLIIAIDYCHKMVCATACFLPCHKFYALLYIILIFCAISPMPRTSSVRAIGCSHGADCAGRCQ